METNQKQQNEFLTFLYSTFGRILTIGIITLVLMIPLTRVYFLIIERADRAETVNEDLENEWGGQLEYKGIYLRVPIIEKNKSKGYAFFYPKSQNDAIKIAVSDKKRGIYNFTVFQTDAQSNVIFEIKKKSNELDWTKAQVGILTNQNARFTNVDTFEINDKKLAILGETQAHQNTSDKLIVSEPFAIPIEALHLKVNAAFSCNASGSIQVKSVANKTQLKMNSNWNTPSFGGTHLPEPNKTKITKKGFEAEWNKINLGDNGKNFTTNQINEADDATAETSFIYPVNQYQLNERTVKYAILVVSLTFAVFFLTELIGKMSIHPLHYLMIGLALILFYVLLLSFSEQIGFDKSYLIACSAIVLVIIWYAKAILQSLKFAIMCGTSIILLYAFLFVIVNLETYALIVGSIGLFFVLVAIMNFTKRLKIQ